MSTHIETNPPPSKTPTKEELHEQFTNKLAWGTVIVCPLIIALPPRKLDLYTFGLIGGTVWGANRLLKVRTGRGILDQLQPLQRPTERTREVQSQLKEFQQSQNPREKKEDVRWETGVAAEVKRMEERKKMEKPQWKKERDAREREALEQGKGYGDLIMDQIYEVWNGGKEKVEEVKEVDKKVVEEQKKEEEER